MIATVNITPKTTIIVKLTATAPMSALLAEISRHPVEIPRQILTKIIYNIVKILSY
jgi:hypothetical protein